MTLLVLAANVKTFAQTTTDIPPELKKFLDLSNLKSYKDMLHAYNDSAYSSDSGQNKIEMPVMAPESRSLQKKHIGYESPRIVYAQQDSKMFLAYAPKAKEAEAIVWNPEKSKYEFYVLENFKPGDQKQKITPVKEEAKCVSCHQNEGPLWTRGGWDAYQTYWLPPIPGYPKEFSQSVLMNKIVKARKGNLDYQGFNLLKDFAGGPTAPSFIDEKIRNAARKLQKGRVCNDICGSDSDCKTQLLLISLGRKNIDESFVQRLTQNWPENGFGYPSSVLPDLMTSVDHKMTIGTVAAKDFAAYDKLNEAQSLSFAAKGIASTSPFTDPFPSLHTIPDHMNPDAQGNYDLIYDEDSSSQGGVFAFDEYKNPYVKIVRVDPKPGDQSDPLYKRPIVGIIRKNDASVYLYKNLSSCFNFTDKEKSYFASLSNDDLKKKLNEKLSSGAWGDRLRDLFKDSPKTVVNQNCADCSTPNTPAIDQLPAPVLSQAGLKLVYKETDATQFFAKYCTECHRGTDGIKELPLNSVDKMKKNENVRDFLEASDMPPKGAKAQPTDQERAGMVEFLKH